MELPDFIYAGTHVEGDVAFHKHKGTEIVQITCGGCNITADGKDFALGKDDLLVIPEGCLHNQKDEAGEENVFFIFRADSTFFPQELRVIRSAGSRLTERIIRELVQMVIEQNTCGAGGLVQTILERYLSSAPEQEYSPQTKRLLKVIHEKYHHDSPIGELAAECGMSAGYFRKVFHDGMGLSPQEYRTKMRLQLSYSLLADPQLSLKEIAEKCGMPDVNYFIRFFHRHTGTTPGAFRKKGNSRRFQKARPV